MILFEFEAKKILNSHGIEIPEYQLISSNKEQINISNPCVIKAQVLSGKRKAAGGIVFANSLKEQTDLVNDLFSKKINSEEVQNILVEKKVDFKVEHYLSISYDTDCRGPVISYSNVGGTDIESREVLEIPIDPLTQNFSSSKLPKILKDSIKKLISIFFEEDLLLLEINPLVEGVDAKIYALDAKINLDDTAALRHLDRNFSERSVPGFVSTIREIQAKQIDAKDYRGTAGSAYFDLDGDIAILASGGGASLTAMDALLSAGGKPANYTEYSGNPPKEKVEKLTHIVLSKPDLKGLWVVGAVANFTNIFETLSGFLEALKTINPKPNYPIVVRRGGPHDIEAFELLKSQTDFDFHLYGPEISITKSAKIIADLSRKYASTNK